MFSKIKCSLCWKYCEDIYFEYCEKKFKCLVLHVDYFTEPMKSELKVVCEGRVKEDRKKKRYEWLLYG